ncbi:MAG TPA: thymidine phosphorylase, partial [Opitutaceae bacterium]
GAGRVKAEDKIDPAVGIGDLVKVGERVEAGATLATIHANDEKSLEEASSIILGGIELSDTPVTPPQLIDEVIG